MKVVAWSLQFGGAITLPTPWGPVAFIRPRYRQDKGVLAHEECHAKQILALGTWTYLWRHIRARFRTRNIWGRGDPVEDECYEAGRIARAES